MVIEPSADLIDGLFEAIGRKDDAGVRAMLLEHPELVNARNRHSFGAPVITAAAATESRAMVDTVLAAGANIDSRSDWWAGSFGALDLASPEMSAYLLEKGATLTAHAAARLGMVAELRALMDSNPNVVHDLGGDGQRPLHFAATAEVVDVLVNAGADLNARDVDHCGTPLQFQIGNKPVAERLVERGAALDLFTAIALHRNDFVAEALRDHSELAEFQIGDSGYDAVPTAPGWPILSYTMGFWWPFQCAVHYDNEVAFQMLLDVSRPELRIVSMLWRGDESALGLIRSQETSWLSSLQRKHHLLVYEAVWRGRLESVRLMLDAGFPLNIQDNQGMSPAMGAAFQGYDDVLELILSKGPDLSLRNVFGGNALGTCLYATLHGPKDRNHIRCVRLLVAAGCEVPAEPYGSAEAISALYGG